MTTAPRFPRRATSLMLSLRLAILVAVTCIAPAFGGGAGDTFLKPGYQVRVYPGPWTAELDLDTLKPLQTLYVFEDSKQAQFEVELPKDAFIVLQGQLMLDTPEPAAWFSPGWAESKQAIMELDGQIVYQQLLGEKEPSIGGKESAIALEPGYHAFRIIHFTPVDRMTCFSTWNRLGVNNRIFVSQVATQAMIDSLVRALDGLTKLAATKPDAKGAAVKPLIDALEENQYLIGSNARTIQAALDFVAAHDAHADYLFKNARGEFGRGARPMDLRWAVFLTQQYLLDYAYTLENIAAYPELLGRASFATHQYFPGPCAPAADPAARYSVTINASSPDTPAIDFWMGPDSTRRPTGAYLAPGTLATVTVPKTIVGQGYRIRVGAHANDLVAKPQINRLFRVSLLYPIDSTQITVASPLGGGLYIEVPVGADAGPAEITFTNIVRSPFYADTRVRQTSVQDWLRTESQHPAPWADFQSEAFMMQLPRTWVYALQDPDRVMAEWDAAVTAVVNVLGFDITEIGREAFYIQPDTQLRNRVFSPGHPQVNVGGVKPYDDAYDGLNAGAFQIKGPRYAPDWVFHEWGHAVALAGPSGENETSNNFLHAVALNGGLGVDMTEAFSTSRGSNNRFRTIDHAAVLWMTGLNFDGGVMHKLQGQYQLKGHAKYADVGRLFGWQTIGDFYRVITAERVAYRDSHGERGEDWGKNIENDRYLRRFSLSSGIDMRPLFHFWGTPPAHTGSLVKDRDDLVQDVKDARAALAKIADNADGKADKNETLREAQKQLAAAEEALTFYDESLPAVSESAEYFDQLIRSGQIKRSAKIYDQLMHYRAMVPADREAFRGFALSWYDSWKGKPHDKKMYWTENDHRKQWDRYSTDSADTIRTAIDQIVALYFPDGRPTE